MKRLLLIAFCLFVFFVTQASSNNTSSTTAMGVGQNEWVCIGKVTACIKTEPHPYGTVSIAIRQYDVKESDKDFILCKTEFIYNSFDIGIFYFAHCKKQVFC